MTSTLPSPFPLPPSDRGGPEGAEVVHREHLLRLRGRPAPEADPGPPQLLLQVQLRGDQRPGGEQRDRPHAPDATQRPGRRNATTRQTLPRSREPLWFCVGF